MRNSLTVSQGNHDVFGRDGNAAWEVQALKAIPWAPSLGFLVKVAEGT